MPGCSKHGTIQKPTWKAFAGKKRIFATGPDWEHVSLDPFVAIIVAVANKDPHSGQKSLHQLASGCPAVALRSAYWFHKRAWSSFNGVAATARVLQEASCPVERRTGLEVLKSESVIDSVAKLLFAAKILLCRLDRNMTEQKLDLLQLPSCHVAELCARAPKVVRCEPINARRFAARFTMCQIAFAESRSLQTLSVRVTFRNK